MMVLRGVPLALAVALAALPALGTAGPAAAAAAAGRPMAVPAQPYPPVPPTVRAPRNLTCTRTSPTTVTVAWLAPLETAGLAGYNITRLWPGESLLITLGNVTSYIDTVDPATGYTYFVQSRYTGGETSTWTGPCSVPPVGAAGRGNAAGTATPGRTTPAGAPGAQAAPAASAVPQRPATGAAGTPGPGGAARAGAQAGPAATGTTGSGTAVPGATAPGASAPAAGGSGAAASTSTAAGTLPAASVPGTGMAGVPATGAAAAAGGSTARLPGRVVHRLDGSPAAFTGDAAAGDQEVIQADRLLGQEEQASGGGGRAGERAPGGGSGAQAPGGPAGTSPAARSTPGARLPVTGAPLAALAVLGGTLLIAGGVALASTLRRPSRGRLFR
ncbi:hypothetical protein Sru01_36960 [Sphaerisporangium rufum]|uniref:Fibronectin type-III domain-containing protein n=1 Tax=Sphaerisporangium rufum TaxID=1381558 RepID=A0A919R2W5_9ACTN|nr:fibronectin type III domain-containing protein [Sphaerisporangium rufum]GII78714.1 hypothetical protein Sru01_36960 [Sphaerisporangium rufum]